MENVRYAEDDGKGKKRDFGKRKDGKKDKKDRGYMMFEEDDSQEESLVTPEEKDTRSHIKLKKHSKPSFKFVKKEKSFKPKEKEKEEKKKDEKKKEEKLKLKKKRIPSDAALAADEKPIFGVPLALAVSRNKTTDGLQLPAMFRECVDYIEEFGLMCEGIYRISGVKSKVQALRDAYNKGLPVYLQEYEPNVVAGLIKQFLRELPEPVLTADLTPKFEQASTLKSVKQRVGEFQRLIEQLPTPNRQLLSWVIVHMTHVIAKEKQNKMSVQNISIVLSPTMQISHRVLNILFTYSKILFRDTVIRKYVPPLKPVTSRWSLDLPESPSSLEEELRKQEALLDELHKDVMRVKDTEKEERLWEVQRVITGLKRNLKLMKKAQAQSPNIARSVLAEKNKEAATPPKAEPPTKLNLKIGEEELDLRSADTQTGMTKQRQAAKLAVKGENTPVTKGLGKKVGLKAVGTPTKDSSMDIGDIEMDISAQSHSQKQRRDSAEVQRGECQESGVGHITGTSEPRASRDGVSHPPEGPPRANQKHLAKSSDQEKTGDTGKVGDTAQVSDAVENAEGVKSSETTKTKDPAKSSDTILKGESVVSQITEPKAKQEQSSGPGQSEVCKRESEKGAPLEGVGKESHRELLQQGVTEKAEVVGDAGRSVGKSYTSSPALSDLSAHSDSEDMGGSKEEGVDTAPVRATLPAKLPCEVKRASTSGEAVVAPAKSKDADRADTAPLGSTAPPGGVAADELAAALNNLVDSETEEDLNQRVMSQFVADFGIEKPAECDEEYEQLLDEYTALLLEEEELTIIGDELRAKIESEQYEIERLDEEITEVRAMREDLYSSDDKTDSSDSDYDDDDDVMIGMLNQLVAENAQLQIQNKDLCDKIYQEVQDCLKTKVQIRMLQQKQLESSKNNELDLLL